MWARSRNHRIWIQATVFQGIQAGYFDEAAPDGTALTESEIDFRRTDIAVRIARILLHEAAHICIRGSSPHGEPHDYDWLSEASQELQDECDLVLLLETCFFNNAQRGYLL